MNFRILFFVILIWSGWARRRPKQARERFKDDEEDEGDVVEEDEEIDWSNELHRMRESGNRAKKKSITDYLQPPTVLDPEAAGEDLALAQSFKSYFTKKNFKAQDFLDTHHLYVANSEKKFPELEVLSYVTPWNRKGKEHATLMATKLNWIAPCWYQIRRASDGEIEITGTHDEDFEWLHSMYGEMNEVGQCRQDLRIVPRVVLETSLTTESDVEIAKNRLLEVMERANSAIIKPGMKLIHGFTLEIPLNEMMVAVSLPRILKAAVSDIAIVFVLPPLELDPQDSRSKQALESLSLAVDRFSVMTYDNDRNGKAIAPIEWVSKVMRGLLTVPSLHPKLLLGLPHYGWRTGGEDMTAEKMVLWLANNGGGIGGWDDKAKEHYFTDTSAKRCSYPSPEMLRTRLELAVELGVPGVAIWELGQGTAAFMEVY
jgi:hypothetical protein